jgi:hypothetical protein
MFKSLFLVIGVFASAVYLNGQNDNVRIIAEARNQSALRELEYRKLELEEKKLYLSTLQGSRITEEKARELSAWILRNLKDYPQGKKAKHAEEDIKIIIEAIASLQKPN